MISLEPFKPSIEKVITGISDIFNVDAAVINKQGELVASTQRYLQQKGQMVHVPSVQAVLSYGHYLVDRPGYMDSCNGCRFSADCPATVELLSSIKLENQPIGVVSLTSFTKEGQHRLSRNTEKYQQILQDVTEIITAIIRYETKPHPAALYETLLEETLNTAPEALFTIDPSGSVVFCNTAARSLLASRQMTFGELADLMAKTLRAIPPTGQRRAECYVEALQASISSSPITVDDRCIGGIVRIHANTPAPHKPLAHPASCTLDSIAGNGPAIASLKQKIAKLANSSSAILISGETGTGKGHLAKVIHATGSRANAPFVAINCASIPESLFESELFGYEDGAFTGAKKGGKPGRFELAEGGTLFLDEIGDMPLHVQPKLLCVLQDMVIERVGGTRSIPLNVRVIAATNKDLEAMVAANAFRADLYYRLNVIPLTIPPLRERLEDLEELVTACLKKATRSTGKAIAQISREALDCLRQYAWPGNIRELENAIEYAVNMESGSMITKDSLPAHVLACREKDEQENRVASKLADLHAEAIRQALQKHGTDLKGKQAAADELGIGIRTLYRKIKAYRIG